MSEEMENGNRYKVLDREWVEWELESFHWNEREWEETRVIPEKSNPFQVIVVYCSNYRFLPGVCPNLDLSKCHTWPRTKYFDILNRLGVDRSSVTDERTYKQIDGENYGRIACVYNDTR